MSRVAIVTDSAADLPSGLAEAEGIGIVPLTVRFGDRTFHDGVDLPMEEFWGRIARGELPTTASPSPLELLERYSAAEVAGAVSVVSIHVSGALSRTAETARLAAADAPLPVAVVDSRSVSLGQALVVRAAARRAAEGADRSDVAAEAERAVADLRVSAFVDTVEFLQRGGRVGKARAAISDLLRIRPVLSLEDGEPTLAARPRTRGRAVQELVERLGSPATACAVFHGGAPEAGALATELSRRCGVEPLVGEIGAITGTHLGPRSLGAAVVRR